VVWDGLRTGYSGKRRTVDILARDTRDDARENAFQHICQIVTINQPLNFGSNKSRLNIGPSWSQPFLVGLEDLNGELRR